MTKWTVIMSHCRIFYSQNTQGQGRTRYTKIVTIFWIGIWPLHQHYENPNLYNVYQLVASLN